MAVVAADGDCPQHDPGRPADGAVRPVYILVDCSGSTARGGVAAGFAQALPLLIDAAGRRPGVLVALLGYSTRAQMLVRLSDPASIRLIPALAPAGLSSLASGLRLLAQSMPEDARQLAADQIRSLPAVVLVVADGLPTDPDIELLAARADLDDATAQPAKLHAVVLGSTDRVAVAGLRMTFHPLEPGAPVDLAASIVAAFERVVGQ